MNQHNEIGYFGIKVTSDGNYEEEKQNRSNKGNLLGL